MPTAAQIWNSMVEAEHAQTERLRDPAPPQGDFWRSLADRFRANPFRTDDPVVELLGRMVKPHQTLLDVGAGAGRFALPLALRCRSVFAVEPSPAMAAALLEEAQRHRICNVSLVQAKWEDAQVEATEVVLCAHVLYGVRDIDSFVRKLEAHARDQVWVMLFREPPQRRIYHLWKRVHGEERLQLPALPQFEKVLEERGTKAKLKALPHQDFGGYATMEEAHAQLRSRLFLTEGSAKDQRLGKALAEELEEGEGVLRLRGYKPMEPVLVSWRPSGKP